MNHDPNSHPNQEWEAVRRLAKRLFNVTREQGDLTAVDVDAWSATWPTAGPADFVKALQSMARSGVEWMPRAGAFAPFMPSPSSALDAPDFSTVIGVVDGARYLAKAAGVQRVRERCGETAAAWMCAEGIAALKEMELGHPEYGPVLKRDLERRYKAFVATAEADVRRGLPAPRATDSGELVSGRSQGGLRRLDFTGGQQLISGPGEAA